MLNLKLCEDYAWYLEWETRVFILKQHSSKDSCFYIFIVENILLFSRQTQEIPSKVLYLVRNYTAKNPRKRTKNFM